MSATNRGAIRRESDFYRTPPEAINTFLDAFEFMPFRYIIEPCAGDGAIVRELAKRTRKPKSFITANPAMSLWLMGYPDEWLSCGVRAMQSSRR